MLEPSGGVSLRYDKNDKSLRHCEWQEKESWDLDNAEKPVYATKKKEEGNVLFKSGKYWRASKKYEKVLLCSDPISLCWQSLVTVC